MTKNEALYKYLKMDYSYGSFESDDYYKVLSYNRVGWSFWYNRGTYQFKSADKANYYRSKLTERVILKMVKLL